MDNWEQQQQQQQSPRVAAAVLFSFMFIIITVNALLPLDYLFSYIEMTCKNETIVIQQQQQATGK